MYLAKQSGYGRKFRAARIRMQTPSVAALLGNQEASQTSSSVYASLSQVSSRAG